MIAYKFRAASQLSFAFDIILNQRLYCASRDSLNDPWEGVFRAIHLGSGDENRSGIARVGQEKSQLLICALSQSYEFIPLWAYYASDFTGLAIEVALPDDDKELVREITYTNNRWIGALHLDNPKKAAIESLFMKHESWEHEMEARVIIEGSRPGAPYYQLPTPVRRVIVGKRAHPALVEAIRMVLKDKGNITLAQQDIDMNGVIFTTDIPL